MMLNTHGGVTLAGAGQNWVFVHTCDVARPPGYGIPAATAADSAAAASGAVAVTVVSAPTAGRSARSGSRMDTVIVPGSAAAACRREARSARDSAAAVSVRSSIVALALACRVRDARSSQPCGLLASTVSRTVVMSAPGSTTSGGSGSGCGAGAGATLPVGKAPMPAGRTLDDDSLPGGGPGPRAEESPPS